LYCSATGGGRERERERERERREREKGGEKRKKFTNTKAVMNLFVRQIHNG